MQQTQNTTNVKLVTFAVFVATFMTAIEGTIVSTAMPTIVGTLHGMEIMNWVFSIYLLTNAMTTPIYGKLSDSIGRKPIFIIGTVIFIIGSSLCGLSQNMVQLILSRAVQGVGAGAIMPVALTILADIYPYEKRAKMMGINNSAWGIASVVGPLFGGFIVDVFSWHWIFLINVPIGIFLIILIAIFLKEPDKKVSRNPLDVLGSLTLMGTLLTFLYGFQLIGDGKGLSLQTILVFFSSVVFLLLFVRAEQHAKDPVISLELFNNSTFIMVNIVAALASGFVMGLDVYLPMWMQGILGLSAGLGGLAVSPMSITWGLGAFFASSWISRMAPKRILAISLLIGIIGGTALAIAPASTPFIFFFFISALVGVGLGIVITTTTVTAQRSVPDNITGVATSFHTLVRTLWQTISVSIFGVILNSQTSHLIANESKVSLKQDMMNKLVNPHTSGDLPKAVVEPLRNILFHGLHVVFLSALLLLVIALVAVLIYKAPTERETSETTK